MKAVLATLDSVRYDSIPQRFIDKWKPTVYENMYSYYHSTVPSLTSFYTGVPPKWHGILHHRNFYDYQLRAKPIFAILTEHGVKVAFSSDEQLFVRMQCVADVPKTKSIIDFLNRDNCFLAFHCFFTHSPYRNEEIQHTLMTKHQRAYLDKDFLKLAREAQRKTINKGLSILDEILEATHAHMIISADHGEAFGEQMLYGHDEIILEPVLHIPFLVVDYQKPKHVKKRCYQSKAFDIILQWFNIKATRTLFFEELTVEPETFSP